MTGERNEPADAMLRYQKRRLRVEAQMYLPAYMREVAQSGNLNHDQHASYVELLADFAEKRDKEFYALRNALRELEERAQRDEVLLRQALKALKDIQSLSSMHLGLSPNPYELTAVLAEIHYITNTALAQEESHEQ